MITQAYICPAKFENLEKTIINKHNNEYMWALNAKCEKMYNNLQNGDICLFGGKKVINIIVE